jgi:hypothetical protein
MIKKYIRGIIWDCLEEWLAYLADKHCYIGEAYPEYNVYGTNMQRFFKFSKSDIKDNVNNKLKINGIWYDRNNILFYDEVYQEERTKLY